MDSVGVGELPDAAAYGDQGSDTVGNIAKQIRLYLPTLRKLGFARIARLDPVPDTSPAPVRHQSDAGQAPARPPLAAVGRMAEASAGKDSVTGHWEMMGLVLD